MLSSILIIYGSRDVAIILYFFQLKAKLKVGDMLLAVNTESFLTINYDEVSICCLTTNNFKVTFKVTRNRYQPQQII